MINIKKLIIVILFGIFLFGGIEIINAQQVLPGGGEGFEDAVIIEAGNYETDHDISRKSAEYFKIIVKAGQMLTVNVANLLTGTDIITNTVLFNENRATLLPGYNNPLSNISGTGSKGTYKWLLDSTNDSYVYYMAVGGGEVNFTAEGTGYEILIEDKFDAGTQTDAGDSFGKATSFILGEYTGYLSGELGTDTEDFYKMSIKKGETLTIKVTPSSNSRMTLSIYNGDRGKVKEEIGSNLGAIISHSITSTKNEDVFVVVSCGEYCSDSIANYDLSISSEEGSVDATILSNGEVGGIDGTIGSGQEITKSFGETIIKMVFQGLRFLFFVSIVGVAVYFLWKKRRKDLKKTEDSKNEEDLGQLK